MSFDMAISNDTVTTELQPPVISIKEQGASIKYAVPSPQRGGGGSGLWHMSTKRMMRNWEISSSYIAQPFSSIISFVPPSLKQFSQNKSFLGIIGVLIVIWFGFNTTKSIFKNFDLVQEIEQLQQEIAILELENANLKFRIGYYRTDAYTEIQARDKLGLVAKGEKLFILPTNP